MCQKTPIWVDLKIHVSKNTVLVGLKDDVSKNNHIVWVGEWCVKKAGPAFARIQSVAVACSYVSRISGHLNARLARARLHPHIRYGLSYYMGGKLKEAEKQNWVMTFIAKSFGGVEL